MAAKSFDKQAQTFELFIATSLSNLAMIFGSNDFTWASKRVIPFEKYDATQTLLAYGATCTGLQWLHNDPR